MICSEAQKRLSNYFPTENVVEVVSYLMGSVAEVGVGEESVAVAAAAAVAVAAAVVVVVVRGEYVAEMCQYRY